MDLNKFQSLTNLSTQICEEKSLLRIVEMTARYLYDSDTAHFVALITKKKDIIYRSTHRKIDFNVFVENNWEDKVHCYSSQKYGYRIHIEDFIIYIENKSPFLEETLCLFTLVENFLNLCCSRQKEKEFISPQTTKKRIKKRKDLKYAYDGIIGESSVLVSELSKLDKVIDSEIPVLIQGQSGTGKELIARAIHMYGARKNKEFISENCAAITETLLESELFGHVKGSFTGAIKDRQGLFEVANKGTLFLDEMGDMSMGMQKKLLRALQNGEIRPVGGKSIKKVDVRIVAATNKDLPYEVQNGTFREDLFYRLNVISITLPPLCERGDDILLLFDFFNKKVSKEMGLEVKPVDEEVKSLLLAYHWPGNIRELQNEVRRMVALSDNVINVDVVSESIRKS